MIYSQQRVGDVWLECQTTSVTQGETFSVDVYANTGDIQLGIATIVVTYDPAVLGVDTASGDSGITALMDVSLQQPSPGRTVAGVRNIPGIPGSPTLWMFTLHLVALADGPVNPDLECIALLDRDILSIHPGDLVYESGRLVTSQDSATQWHTLSFTNVYSNPIVIMGTPSYDGADPMVMRVKDVTSTSCEYQLDEWNYLNGSHTSEEFGYLVLEAGNYRVGDVFLEAGVVTEVTHEWKDGETDGYSFDGTHLLLTQVVTRNGSAAVTTRLKNVYRNSFEVRVQEEEQADGTHKPETVHYLAITCSNTAQYLNDWKMIFTGEIQSLDSGGTDIPSSYIPDPVVFAQIMSFEGNNPAALRYESLSPSLVRLVVQEEQSADSETNHDDELVRYLFLEER